VFEAKLTIRKSKRPPLRGITVAFAGCSGKIALPQETTYLLYITHFLPKSVTFFTFMPSLKDFPHRAVFEACPILYASSLKEAEPEIAKASLDNLRGLIPYHIDLDKNVDLLAIAFNAATINVANLNDDVMDTYAAINVAKSFSDKQINYEHDRKKIIGHVTRAGFSSCGESNLLYSMDVEGTLDPFHIALGGVIYRVVDKDLAASIEESTVQDSPKFNSISASWELMFPDFRIAMGSKNIKEAEIIDNPAQIAELQKYLKAYGGKGSYNNAPVYRLIGSNAIAAGIGLVEKPAGRVRGLITKDSPQQKTSTATFFGSFFEKNKENKKTSVTQNNPKNMENIEKILERLEATLASIAKKELKEEAKAGLVADITEEIKKASEKYSADLAAKEAAKASAEQKAAELAVKQEKLEADLAAASKKLTELESKAAAEAAANIFSARMDDFNNEFELDDEDRKILAADLKDMDDKDETFAAYKNKMAKLMSGKSKKGCKAAEEAKAKALEEAVAAKLREISTASTNKNLSEKELAAKALEEAKAKKDEKIANNNSAQSENEKLRDKWKNAFSKDSVTTQY